VVIAADEPIDKPFRDHGRMDGCPGNDITDHITQIAARTAGNSNSHLERAHKNLLFG